MTLAQAAAMVRDVVDATAAEVLPSAPARVDELSSGRKLCEPPALQDEDYGVVLDVPVDEIGAAVERARSYWEGRGFEVRVERIGTDIPALFVDDFRPEQGPTGDSYAVEFSANTESGQVFIGGSTPCLPAE
ncbi:MAG: hypothetical protein ACRD0U_09465 [Acidimicrobiales bacterium]